MDRVLNHLSKAVLSAIDGTPTQQALIPHVLRDLIKLEYRPGYLIAAAYEWCSVIYAKRERIPDWESLLPVCLEIGFRHLDFQTGSIEASLTHTKHHRGLVDVVFQSQESESIADLLQAWTLRYIWYLPEHQLLECCPVHLVGLHNLVPFSPRLRWLVIRSVEVIGYKGFEGVAVGEFVELLNHLHVTAEEMDNKLCWVGFLWDAIKSIEGAQHLSDWYWEFLVFTVSELMVEYIALESTAPESTDPESTDPEPTASEYPAVPRFIGRLERQAFMLAPWKLELDLAHSLQIITSLAEAKEWNKLECWIGIVWMLGAGGVIDEDLERSMVLLFCQRPGALQKLEQWMERWSQRNGGDMPESFKRICKQANEAAQRGAL